MEENINVSDLPSVKFIQELKDRINYNILDKYVNVKPTEGEMNAWVTDFKTNAEQYLLDTKEQFSINNDKRCIDFYYILYDIIQKIYSFKRESLLEVTSWTTDIKDWRDNYFTNNMKFNCNHGIIYYDADVKTLYDYCEDSTFIKGKLIDIQRSNNCKSIIDNMSVRKGNIINKLNIIKRQSGLSIIPDTSCNTDSIDTMLPHIECSSMYKPPSTRSDLGEITAPVENEALKNQSLQSSGEFLHEEQNQLSALPVKGTNNAVRLLPIPFLGILFTSYLLYKFTPFGTKLHDYIRTKRNIPINQNDESTNQLLSNTINSKDMYSDSMLYNISYQNLQN
ncbi:PIR Superfamily Protein [Plasmodium ovale wallikeri]|uniref:PIR Superfamily Protein n=2 Tax=Plasmodium ovale TaxID=36330 RepID=A0A1A9AHS0_PLAOA|nr:PIR Superfamily Protein [Plasmodium ovale wallikeri]SBT57043.1 PIR Superfamily Protein [Plasmodium ovale wallikeri]SBT74498.1 PIR protein [Plasmodium ovale]